MHSTIYFKLCGVWGEQIRADVSTVFQHMVFYIETAGEVKMLRFNLGLELLCLTV